MLRRIKRQHDEAVQDLAESIRTEVLIPLCRKHRMIFLSGNNDFFFVKEGRNIGDDKDCHEWPDIRAALQLLMEEVSHNMHLGFYVENVTVKDLDGN